MIFIFDEGIPADVGDTVAVGLDEITVLRSQFDAACDDATVIVDVAIIACDCHFAAGVVDGLALAELQVRCCVDGSFFSFSDVFRIGIRMEGIRNRDARVFGLATAFQREISQLFRPLHRIAVQIESTALSDLSIGLFAHDFDVTEDEVVRGGILHLDFGIPIRRQRAAAGDGIALEVNVAELRNRILDGHVAGHVRVRDDMEQRLAIPLATFDFTAVCAIELPVPFRTALRFEIFRRFDLFGEVINVLLDGLVGLRIGGLQLAEHLPVSTNLFFIHVRWIVARGLHRRFVRCLGLCFFRLRICQYTSCLIIGCLGGLIVLDFLDIFVGCIIDIRMDLFLRRIISDLVLQRIFCRGESGFRMCLGVLRRSCLLLRRLIRRMRGTHRRHLVLLLFRRSLIFLDGLQHSVLGSGHAVQHGLRFVILRLRAGVDFYENPVRRAIAQPLLDHLAFDERNLCLIRCLRRRIADVICEFFLELSKALRERFRRHLLLAQSESDITLCRDTGLPCSVFVFPTDGDGLISMDARLGFAIQRCRSLGRHFRFPDGTTFRTEDFTHLVHPVLHFTRTGGFRLARCRLEIDVPVSKERTIHRKSCVRGNFREGILLRGNRDRGRIQDIALRLDIQLTDCSRGVSTRGDADVALRGFCLAAKSGLRLSIIGHLIRRTSVTCRTKDIDHRGAREVGIIFAADTD